MTINPPPRRVGSQPPQTEAVSAARPSRLDQGQLSLIPHRPPSAHPERLRASNDGPHWFVTPGNPARLEARQVGANARSKARAYAVGVGVTLDGLMCLVEPGTTNARAASARSRPLRVTVTCRSMSRSTKSGRRSTRRSHSTSAMTHALPPWLQHPRPAGSTSHDRDRHDTRGQSISVRPRLFAGRWLVTRPDRWRRRLGNRSAASDARSAIG
jgi:hypothetical protein